MVQLNTFCEDASETKTAINSRKPGHHGGDHGSARALMRMAARSTTVAVDDANPVWAETFELAPLKHAGRAPFVQALMTAFGGDGGLEVNSEFEPLAGQWIEKKSKRYAEGQVCRFSGHILSLFL